MSVTVEWRGMNDFIEALKSAPSEIRAEADVAGKETSQAMAADVRAAYRRVSDTFLKGAITTKRLAPMAYRVRAGGSAHIYELGTGVRHTKANKNRGQMPAKGPIFIPTRERYRAKWEGRCRAIAQQTRGRSTSSGLL